MTGKGMFCAALISGIAAMSCGCAAWPNGQQRPHIVVILADDLGWKDVGYHGSEIKTPHIDGLAKVGVRLAQFYVQPVCSPTRSSLLTGRYPIRQGLQVGVIRPWADYGLALEERTLAQGLKEAGYRTAITGKWHLGAHEPAYLPTRRGFDHQYGHYLGMIDYFTHEREGGLDWHRDDRGIREEGYSTFLIGREAVRIVEGHEKGRPLFLYVPFNAPHTPLQAPKEYVERYADIKNVKRRKYAAMVTCMDEAIGEIVGALKKGGMWDNTVVFFCSDNGGPTKQGADNGPLRGGKGRLWEGGVRVPALAVWSGKLEAGGVVDEMMHIVDLYPTLLRIGGGSLDQPLPLDGADMWPTVAEGRPSPRKEILHNLEPTRGAIRRGDWKLVVLEQLSGEKKGKRVERRVELFNIAADPSEKRNLAEQHPEKVKEFEGRLAVYAQQAVPPRGRQKGKKPEGFAVPKVWGEED